MRLPILLSLSLCLALGGADSAFAVAGGATVEIASAPFVVSTTSCTGTLIAPDRVLTAAHCLDGLDPDNTYVIAGADAHDVVHAPDSAKYPLKGASSAPGFRLAFPFAHRSPQNATAVDDVGLVILAKPVVDAHPVAIAGPGDAALEQPGRPVRLLGYGLLAARPSNPFRLAPALQGGDPSLISRADCLRSYPRAVQPTDLCAHDVAAGPVMEPCPGDSGGPLLADTPNGPVQIGVTSWGAEVRDKACGATRLPSVWMRVSAYHDFLTALDPVLAPHTSERRAGLRRSGHRLTCVPPRFGGSPDPCTLQIPIVPVSDVPITARFADVQAPAATLVQPVDGQAVAGRIPLTATATDNAGVTSVAFRVRGTALPALTAAPFTTIFDTQTLPDGPAAVTVTASDAAGNQTTPGAATVTIDNTKPVLTVSGPDGVTFGPGETAAWTITASDATTGPPAVRCSVVPAGSPPAFGACTAAGAERLSGLADGRYTITVRATDRAGNAFDQTRTVAFDAGPPETTITAGPEDGESTDATTITWGFDTSEPGATFECRVFAGEPAPFGPCTSATQHTAAGLAAGAYTFEVRATDAVGKRRPVARAADRGHPSAGCGRAAGCGSSRPDAGRHRRAPLPLPAAHRARDDASTDSRSRRPPAPA